MTDRPHHGHEAGGRPGPDQLGTVQDAPRPAEHHGTGHHGTGHGGGHDKHEGHSPEMFRDRLLVSVLLTIPILWLSPQVGRWLGFTPPTFPGSAWVSPILATILFVYGGGPFLRGARRELAARLPGMMTLISVAITVAFAYSLAVSLGLPGDPFYWELATLIDVMLLGHWIEMRSVRSASRALEHLASLVPSVAHKLVDGEVRDVPVTQLIHGDLILVRPGEQVPADGVIVEGSTSMNEAFLTGESRPVAKGPGDEVVAGAINGEGVITVRVTRVGDETTLSQIVRLVEEAQASRSRFQALADRAAFWLTIVAIGVAVPTFGAWLLVGEGITFALARAVTVLVIACPHALGLAIPLVTVNATGMSARHGILVRNREAFERGRDIRFVAFDKTGTLTEGRFEVASLTVDGVEEDLALAIAAGLEQGSEHPLADAIVEAATARAVRPMKVAEARAVPGHGLEGRVDGPDGPTLWRIGRPEWAYELGVSVPPALEDALRRAEERGDSPVVLVREDRAVAVFALSDRIRPSAKEAVARLHAMGVRSVMVTGDAEAVARTVAAELGIDRVYARVLPQDKARIVSELREEAPTAFVGDGINDAPALLAADLGIAIGAGTNVAIESADLVLVENDPLDVVRALQLARLTYRKMIENLAWATGYNVVAIPLAAGVLARAGIVLSPAIGALFMSLSTVIVALNAMLMRRARLD